MPALWCNYKMLQISCILFHQNPKSKIMFKKQMVKALSIVAIILSLIGLLATIVFTFVVPDGSFTLAFFLGTISWSLLLWSSIIGYQLSASYKLEEEQYKKVGIRIYIIIVAFILFFFVGLTIGLIISVAIFVTLWALKSNYDDWEKSEPEFLNDIAEKNNDAL